MNSSPSGLLRKAAPLLIAVSAYSLDLKNVYQVHLRVDLVMLQKLAIGIRSCNDGRIDQCPCTLFYCTAREPADEPYGKLDIEWQILIQACLNSPGARVVDNDFGWRQGSQAADVGSYDGLGICVTREFAKLGFIIKVIEYRALRRYGLLGEAVLLDLSCRAGKCDA